MAMDRLIAIRITMIAMTVCLLSDSKLMEAFECFAFEFFSMVRVRDLDQRFRPLSHILSIQVSDTIFGNNIVGVCPRCYNASSLLQECGNS